MGIIGTFARIGNKIGLSPKSVVSWMVSSGNFRSNLNSYYNGLDQTRKEAFHEQFSKIFRDKEVSGKAGIWSLSFAGKPLKAPLRANDLWLDWDSAVSYVGHDMDVKNTYEQFLSSEQRPTVFFDIGANYGTHTVMMALAGLDCTPFEPNPNCHTYFREALKLNGLEVEIQPVAMGSEPGEVELWFPERDTWLGTVVTEVKDDLDQGFDLKKVAVKMITLDDFVADSGKIPQLIKIDTEGHEVPVLKGGEKLLRAHHPVVLFESNSEDQRRELATLFSNYGYELVALPIWKNKAMDQLTVDQLVKHKQTNFAAVPPGFKLT